MTREELAALPIEQLKAMALQKAQAKAPNNREQLAQLPIEELRKMAAEKAMRQQEIATQQQEGAPQRQLQAGVEALGQGALFGYLPQIQAAEETASSFINQYIPGTPEYTDRQLKAQGFTIDQKGDTYTERRDTNIARQAAQAEEFPLTTGAGQVAGAIASGIATGGLGAAGNTGRVLTTAQKLKQAALAGGIYGAIQNPGDTEGEVSPLQLGDRLENALTGAATGAALSGVMQAGGKIVEQVKKLPGIAKKMSYDEAWGAIGGERGNTRKILKQGRIKPREMGKELIEEGIVEFGDDIEKIKTKITGVVRKSGEAIGEISQNTDDLLLNLKKQNLSSQQQKILENARVSMNDFANEIESELKSKLKGAGKAETISKVKSILSELAEEGDDVSIDTLRQLRQSVDGKMNWGKATNEMDVVQESYKLVRDKLQDKIKHKILSADKLAGSKNLAAFEKANRKYSSYKTIEGIANDRIAAQNNKFISVGEGMMGGAGSFMGGPVGFVVGVAASRAIKRYGGSTGTVGLNKVANILAKDPAKLGKYSGIIFDAYNKNPKTIHRVVADLLVGDPEFKKIVNQKEAE